MTTDFFVRNRRTLAERFPDIPLVITAYTSLQRSGDASFRFEQESNFWYLTGISAPDWWFVCIGEKSYLVAPEKSEIHTIFDGSLSASDAKSTSGVDQVLTFAEGKTLLKDLSIRFSKVATLGSDPRKEYYDFSLNPAQGTLRKRLGRLFKEIVDCRVELSRLRAIKQPEEVAAIRKAIALTADAFEKVKSSSRTLKHEYEVEALFDYEFRNANAFHAYDPIVAVGLNACTLHYVANNQPLVRGFLLLDIGARVGGYAADITRTYVVGQPTERERAVHAAVVDAQEKIIALLGPGVSVKEYGDQVDVIMKQALDSLGLLKTEKDYRKYFPHSVSHGLGIDVHDSLGGPEVFQPGMVLTVEPGIYIPEESIGVRIEDDILITETGYENLSGKLSVAL